MQSDVQVEKPVEVVVGGSARVQVLPNGRGAGVPAGNNGAVAVSIELPSVTVASESPLPQPDYLLSFGRVMTDEQLETLRRQISVYATICRQLVEMHKAVMAQTAIMPSMMAGHHLPFDPVLGARSSGRQRWTPSQIQLQTLEDHFVKENGTPSKQKIKEITSELGQHGQISETNVYNWFQNRKARAKRKQQPLTQKEGDSEVDTDEAESRKEKRATIETSLGNQDFGQSAVNSFGVDGSFGGLNEKLNTANFVCDNPETLLRSQIDAGTVYDEGFIHRNPSEFCTLVVLIDGKPWEVPSGVLDLKGSFGEASALLDSQRQIVPTDEAGFTISPLNAGESYTLISLEHSTVE